MPAEDTMERTGIAPDLKTAVIVGGSAGNHTVTGIRAGEVLITVIRFIGGGTDVTDVSDITGEFTISADDTINNGGGTDTTGSKLFVLWAAKSAYLPA